MSARMPRYDLGPKPHLGYTQSLIDRAAERRLDSAWLDARLKDPSTRTYVIGGEMIVLKKGDGIHEPAFTPDEARALAPNAEQVFLGMLDGAARFGTGIAPASAESLKARDDLFVIDLRSIAIQGLVNANHLPPLAELAKAAVVTQGTWLPALSTSNRVNSFHFTRNAPLSTAHRGCLRAMRCLN